MSETYDVLAVRYATRTALASQVYLNHHVYGESDRSMQMDYYFWVATNDARTVVIDTGFTPEVGNARGRTTTCSVASGVARLGIDPATVATVVVTHAHYDHTGNLGLFGAAEVVIADREMEFWTGDYAQRAQFAHSAEPDDIEELCALDRAGRLRRISGTVQVAPGIVVHEVGGHTPGQLIVTVAGRAGEVLLASDALHYYDELTLDRPFVVVADLEQMYRGFDRLTEIVAESGAALVAGHDPEVLTRFPPLDPADPGFAVKVG